MLALALLALGWSHRVEGLVVSVEPSQGVVVVAHGPVKGVMPAMTMPFRVDRAAALAGVLPGMRIRFKLTGGRKIAFALHLDGHLTQHVFIGAKAVESDDDPVAFNLTK